MNNTVLQSLCAAALSVTAVGLASGAQASTIVNISAVTATGVAPVTLHLDPGLYKLSWVGKAGGGLYDGFNLNCPSGVCPNSGWRDDVFYFLAGSTDMHHLTLEAGPSPFASPAFTSAALALAAYQGAGAIKEWDIPAPYGGANSSFEGHAQPWIINLDQAADVSFFILDGTRNDNVGGVSLMFSAAPEPAAWGLMILGFGLAGAALRRRTMAA